MRIKAVQEIIDVLRGRKQKPEFLYKISHRQYGKIYMLFNPDVIIKITKSDYIKEVLKQCTKEEYENRLSAVLDNMKSAEKYLSINDYIAKII